MCTQASEHNGGLWMVLGGGEEGQEGMSWKDGRSGLETETQITVTLVGHSERSKKTAGMGGTTGDGGSKGWGGDGFRNRRADPAMDREPP